jgi:hypothetical protein
MPDTWCDLSYRPSIILGGSRLSFLTLLNAHAGIRWSCAWVHAGLQTNVWRENTHSGSKVVLIGVSEWLCGKFTHLPNVLISNEVASCSSAATTFSSLLAVCWHELKPFLLIHFLFTYKTCGEALVELGNWQVVMGVERSLRILQTRTLSVCFKSTTRRILSSTMTSRLISFFVFLCHFTAH